MPIIGAPSGMAAHSSWTPSFRSRIDEDLCVRLRGAEKHQPRNPPRRDLRPARPERRRQDHADQHRLRHRQPDRRHDHRRRPRHPQGRARRARPDRARAAGALDRRVRDRLGHDDVQPRPVRQAEERRVLREGAALAVAVGQEGQQDHDAVGRHEAARHDRESARARAAGPVPRRADRRRRRRAAQGHVERRARPAQPRASRSS